MRMEDGGRFMARLRRVDPLDAGTGLLVAALVVLALMTFRDYGVSNDEEVQHRYGELIVAYYASGLVDRTLFGFRNLYLYGGLFDIIAVLLARALPFDPVDIRHVLSALTGIGGVAATWATARAIAGPRAGLIAALALALWGPWYGGMFNHTKDIPFAAAMIAATYFLCRAVRDLPHPRARDILGYGLMLGAALGLRAMGLLAVIYAFAAIALEAARRAEDRSAAWVFVTRSITAFLPAFALGYFMMLAAWPWASLDPLNPLRAIFAFAHFHYEIRTIIAGAVYTMADVPRWYVPLYLVIKLPLIVLVGAAIAMSAALQCFIRPRRLKVPQWETAFVAFAALFPLLCQVVARGPAFTGLRHFLYLAPPLAVLTGIGFDALFAWAAAWDRRAVFAGVVALSAVFLWQASQLARLHPYEYISYNALVGGIAGADRRYAMDYWVNIMPEAVRGLEAYLARTAADAPAQVYTVGVCGERFAFEKYASPRLKWTPGWLEADFFIAPTHMNCDRLVLGKTVVAIERLGVLIGVVKDRRGFVQHELVR
jgi:hypothetical protein